MISFISLKTKITLLLLAFTLVLALVFLSDLWVNGRRSIRRGSRQQLQLQSEHLVKAVHKQLHAYRYDLSALAAHLVSCPQGQSWAKEGVLRAFVEGYAGSILRLWYMPADDVRIYSVKARKIYGGEIAAQIRYDMPMPSINGLDSLSLTSGKTTLEIAHGDEKNGWLLMQVQLYTCFKEVLEHVTLPGTMKMAITDDNGYIRYAKDVTLLKQQIGRAFAQTIPQKPLESGIAIEGQEKTVWLVQHVEVLPLMLFLCVSEVAPKVELIQQIHRTLLISLFLLILALLVSRMMVQRFSHSINEVTRVSSMVADGDFSQILEIDRHDEIGYLINGFNAMVDRLGESYAELKETNMALETRYEELKIAKAKLSESERLALIGETVSKISHEIQNRIGGVSIWVQNLEVMAGDRPEIRPYIEEIENALNRFMELLMRFKQFYRLPELCKEEVDVGGFVRKIASRYSPEAESHGVKLTCNVPAGRIYCRLDGTQIEEALLNLIKNSLYHSPEGAEIGIGFKVKQSEICMFVVDRGPGLDDVDLDSLFRPFYTTKSSGSGLGLAMVQRIARAHGGEVTACTRSGGGAEFCICLPLTALR